MKKIITLAAVMGLASGLGLPAWAQSEDEPAPVAADAPLTRQRLEDLGSDLWTTFNVLQENLVRGGLAGRSSNNRRVTTRPIVGIDSNLALNRGLWELAEAMLRQKRGL